MKKLESEKNPAAVYLAQCRAKSLSPERRSEIARGAVNARIKKYKQKRKLFSSATT